MPVYDQDAPPLPPPVDAQDDLPFETGEQSQPQPQPEPKKSKPIKTAKISGKFTLPGEERIKDGVAIVLNAVEKWGKTTFGAHAPEAAIIMAPRELGYYSLIKAGSVPNIPSLVIENGWNELMEVLNDIENNEQGCRNLVLDALTGMERLCHEHVCQREYGGEWGNKGFTSYQQGYGVSVNDWLLLLNALDRIKHRGINVILLGHSLIKTFKNPSGPDFDRYVCDLHEKTWSATHKWADVILFGTYLTAVEMAKGQTKLTDKGKGIGGTRRVVYTQRRDAWDAGSRFALPERIDLDDDPSNSWKTITSHFIKEEN